MRVRADRPRVNDATFHVEQVSRAAHAEPGVAVVVVGLVPIQQLRRPLQRLICVKRSGRNERQGKQLDRGREFSHNVPSSFKYVRRVEM